MDPITLAILASGAAFILLVLRVPIAFCIGIVACVGLLLRFSWAPGTEMDLVRGLRPTLSIIGTTAYGFVSNYPLSMIPMFIALGHVAFAAGITTDLFDVLNRRLRFLPGGLAVASVTGCSGFSAITGSSVACAAAMGRIAVPEMVRHGYDKRLATGAVAAGGTLGSLIPPSLLFVIYSIFTEQSVRELFVAGIIPGILSLFGFLLTIFIWCWLKPSAAPRLVQQDTAKTSAARDLISLWPLFLLLAIVIAGIGYGFFTPTEAAAVSLMSATLIGLARKKLDWRNLTDAAKITVQQTAMIFAVAMAAKIFATFVSLTRIVPTVLDMIQGVDPSIFIVMGAIVLLYLVIGMFLDSIGILVLTLPFTVPLVESMGMDLIWFGVIVIKLLEIGLITPPIGLNAFVIKSVAPKDTSLGAVFQGCAAFLALDFVVLGLLLAFPVLSLILL
ncbi:TRAP transporter large permease [Sulfitobacter sp. M22]|uniref:TRAP transporter large permease n=1 Tax=Sulfitobacter sp. M22 TaxID=2675332 RepID=UPI001F1B2AF8|nr:TRAP transporter large permease [Sulfitobacter sp. M22]MCF7728133.1 TRAP transporter large permease subunit [Sulfitobacter sp. M22]